MALFQNYIAKTDTFNIEGDLLIPGNLRMEPLRLDEEEAIQKDPNKQGSASQFMKIKTSNQLIDFALKHGILTREYGESYTNGQSIRLLLLDAALLRWTATLIYFLAGNLKDEINIIPTEEVIHHYAEHFALENDYLKQIPLEARIKDVTNKLISMDKELINIEGTNNSFYIDPESTYFVKDVLDSIALTVCRQVFRAPHFTNNGKAIWNIHSLAIVPRLFYEFFESLKHYSLQNCQTCGHYFLKDRKYKDYCSSACKRRQNQRDYRKNKNSEIKKSTRGRKLIEKEGL